MRIVSALIASALVLGGATAYAAPARTPEAKLAKALEGRVAGEPVSCINLRDIQSSQIIDKTAILYEGPRGVVYMNTPTSGASSLRDGQILVTKTIGAQLCSIDTVTLVDSGSKMQDGWVGLGKFVPYAKVAKTAN